MQIYILININIYRILFSASKQVQCLLVKLPPLSEKIPPAKFPISPYLLTLFGNPCLTMLQIKTIPHYTVSMATKLDKLMTYLVGLHSDSHAMFNYMTLLDHLANEKRISLLSQYILPPNFRVMKQNKFPIIKLHNPWMTQFCEVNMFIKT